MHFCFCHTSNNHITNNFLDSQTDLRKFRYLPNGATSFVKPINKTKSLVSKITDPVGSTKRRRMEQHAGSSPIGRIRLRKPVAVIERQILTDARKCQNGVVLALAAEQRSSPPELEAREEENRGGERRGGNGGSGRERKGEERERRRASYGHL